MAYGPAGWSQRVAINLKEKIDRSEKSLNQLAQDTGIPLSTLFRRYRSQNPWDTEQIEKVAKALDIDPDCLIREARAAEVSA